MPIYTTPATTPGTTRQGKPDHGFVLPAAWLRPWSGILPPNPPSSTRGVGMTNQHASPPATLSSLEAKVPASTYPADIIKPLALTPSVAGTLYNASPIGGITSVAQDLPGLSGRPLLPLGIKDRLADVMTPGTRERVAAWTRAFARFRSNRPTSGGRVSRE